MPQSYSLNEKEKKECVALARKAISHFLERGKLLDADRKGVSEKLREKKASFVTLTKNGVLRGCVGHLEARKPLYKDIIESAVSAAFRDDRFPQLEKSELGEIRIGVSVLTDPIEINFESPEELLEKIEAGKDGLIIQKGYRSATFLPSVWDEIKTKEAFLGHLCLKAGLSVDEWKKPGMKVQKYGAIKAEE
jgi:AmmeMemoRadiSam system protein A